MKKLTAILLTFAIAVTEFVVPASAATKTKIWNGKADTSWYTGKKTSYDISTPEELAGLSKLVNSGKSMEGIIINEELKSGTQYDLLIKAAYEDGTKKTIKNGKLSFKA